jgi:hypothetical protein
MVREFDPTTVVLICGPFIIIIIISRISIMHCMEIYYILNNEYHRRNF